MKKIIYLAGGRDSGWRDDLRLRWKDKAQVLDPFVWADQNSIQGFTGDDLNAIRRSDLVFGNCTFERFDGMALEFGFAFAIAKPIIFVCTLPRIPSMMAGVSQALFTSLDAATVFVEERYL